MFEILNCILCNIEVIYDFVNKVFFNFDQVGGLVVVDIDEGLLSINLEIVDDLRLVRLGDSDSIEDFFDIFEILEEVVKLFFNVCRKVRFQFDFVDIKR